MSLERIIESVRILSLPAGDQETYLKRIGLLSDSHSDNMLRNIDELALQFEDCVYFVNELSEKKEISAESAKIIFLIDEALSEMSNKGQDNIWTVKGLFKSKEWSKIRELANNALKALINSGNR